MKQVFYIILVSLPIFLLSQETKKIKKKDTHEIYFVLKSDNSIKHGQYEKYDTDNKLIASGYYKFGRKDSIWNWNGKLRNLGSYKDDNRIGVWEFYDIDGELQQKYDFSKKELLFDAGFNKNKDKQYRIIMNNDTIETTLDQSPVYIGAAALLMDHIIKNIKYPSKARENGITGKVYIVFIIDKEGIPKNHKIKSGIGYGCDEEALRMVKTLPNDWVPGKLNQENVEVEYTLPISFKL